MSTEFPTKRVLDGLELKRLRDQLHLTQSQVAESLGIYQQRYSNIERGVVSPKKELYDSILSFLQTESQKNGLSENEQSGYQPPVTEVVLQKSLHRFQDILEEFRKIADLWQRRLSQ